MGGCVAVILRPLEGGVERERRGGKWVEDDDDDRLLSIELGG